MANRINMGTVAPKQVAWLWEGRIACGKITLLDGDPGEGKSLVTLDIAARLSRGRPMPLEEAATYGSSTSLFLLCEDDLRDTVSPRLSAADADQYLIDVLPDLLTIPEHLGVIEEHLRDLDARLLVIDPLNGYLGKANTNSDSSVRAALMPLVQMASRLDVAVVGVRHFTKARGGVAQHRGQGSTAYAGLARCVLAVGADPEDAGARILAVSKGNLASEVPSLRFRRVVTAGSARIEWEGPCDISAEALCAGAQGADDHRASREARDFLLARLADCEKLAEELYQEAREQGIAERTLRRVKSQLGIRERREGPRWLWRLRDQTLDRREAASRLNGQVGPTRTDPDQPAKWPSGQRSVLKSPFGPPQDDSPAGQLATWPDEEDPAEPADQAVGGQEILAPAPVAPAPEPKKSNNSGGYVHLRTRKAMLVEGKSLGIPEVALKHWKLLKDGVKPTKQGYLDTEDLIAKVKAAKTAGQDPASLWAPYLPPPPLR